MNKKEVKQEVLDRLVGRKMCSICGKSMGTESGSAHSACVFERHQRILKEQQAAFLRKKDIWRAKLEPRTEPGVRGIGRRDE